MRYARTCSAAFGLEVCSAAASLASSFVMNASYNVVPALGVLGGEGRGEGRGDHWLSVGVWGVEGVTWRVRGDGNEAGEGVGGAWVVVLLPPEVTAVPLLFAPAS